MYSRIFRLPTDYNTNTIAICFTYRKITWHNSFEDNKDLEMTGQVFLLGIITNTEKYSLNPIHGF